MEGVQFFHPPIVTLPIGSNAHEGHAGGNAPVIDAPDGQLPDVAIIIERGDEHGRRCL